MLHPPKAEQGIWMRRGIEAGLIALHRLVVGHSPWAFESRPENDDWEPHAPPLDWSIRSDPTAQTWMGLDWTPAVPLSELDRITVPELGVYRIWDGGDECLRYIGEGGVASRLSNHRQTDGDGALFSAAALPDGAHGENEKHRRDIEAELIGAHVLVTERPPKRQFNHDPQCDSHSDTSQSRLF